MKSGDEGGGESKEKEGKSKSEEVERNYEERRAGMQEKEKKKKKDNKERTLDLIDLTEKSPVLAGSHVDEAGNPMTTRPEAVLQESAKECENMDNPEGLTQHATPKDSDAMETDVGETEDSEAVEEEARKQRRKRKREKDVELSPVLSDGMSKMLSEIDRLCTEVECMKKYTREFVNTKKEIKEKANQMSNIAKQIAKVRNSIVFRTPMEPYQFEMITQKSKKVLEEVTSCSQEGKANEAKKDEQPMYCGRCRDEIGKEERIVKEIVQELDRVNELGEEDIKILVKKDWPVGVYKNTKIKQGKITKEPLDVPAVVMIAEEEAKRLCQGADNWIDRMAGRPGLLKTVAVKKHKPYKSRRQSLLISLEEEGDEEPEYSDVYVLVVDMSDFKSSWEAISTICRNAVEAKQINVAMIGNTDNVTIRKMYESLLRNSDKEVVILTPGGAGSRRSESIIVKNSTAEARSFADLLKGVKEGVDPSSLNVNIKNIKKTKDGGVMIVTDGSNTDRLMKEIEDKVGGTRTALGGRKTVEILDLDPTVTKEEVVEGLNRVASVEERADTVVDSLRATNSGFQFAQLSVPRRLGEKLIQAGTICIGWTSCRVKERIHIDRCINCLQIGHISSRCTEPRSKDVKCLRCACTGHLAKNCEKDRYCVKCEVLGHRNDTFACPFYREMVQKRRRAN